MISVVFMVTWHGKTFEIHLIHSEDGSMCRILFSGDMAFSAMVERDLIPMRNRDGKIVSASDASLGDFCRLIHIECTDVQLLEGTLPFRESPDPMDALQ